MNHPAENNPIRHTLKIKALMRQIIHHLREDVGTVAEPKVRTLFETSSEVLARLVKAFDDYEKNGRDAWRTRLIASLPKGRTTNASRR